MQIAHPDLLADALAFCKRRKIAPTRFGHDALGDPNLIRDLAAGRELRRATVAKVHEFMAQPAPADSGQAA